MLATRSGGVAGKIWDVADSADFARHDRAGMVELLRLRGGALLAADRALLDAVYLKGQRTIDLARVAGCSVRVIRTRVRRLSHRMTSRSFVFVSRHSGDWPAMRRAVARACFIEGRSLRSAAAELGLTQSAVRHHREAVLALLEHGVKQ